MSLTDSNNQRNFLIKTEKFEGPLDLLLDLIEKRKLLINDVSLAKITDDYISYIKENSNMTIGQNSHFILVASTLLLIKSKSLLPTIELSDEEEQSVVDLETRLKIRQRMKDIEPTIQNIFGKNMSFFRRQVFNESQITFAPTKQISVNNMFEFMKNLINILPKIDKMAKAVVGKIISLEEMINRLTKKVKQSIKMSFKEFSGSQKNDRMGIIVSFLAMLELVKQGIIETSQPDHNSDIEMQTKEFETPNYS